MADIDALKGITNDEAARLRSAGVTTGDGLLAAATDVPRLAARSGLSFHRIGELTAAQADQSLQHIVGPARTHALGLVRATALAAILAVAGVAMFVTMRLTYAAPVREDSAMAQAISGRLVLTVRLATAPVSAATTPFTSTLYASPKDPSLSSAQAFPGVNVLALRTDNNVTVASVAVDRATADAIAGAAAASEFYLTWPAPQIK